MLARGRVLHIDDEESIRFTIKMLLEDEEYEVIQAENGQEGYKKAIEYSPDVILLDINMPILNGYETLEKLKANDQVKDIPVIMNTANNQEDDQVAAFEAGAVDYIPKPAREMELLARLDTHISHYRMLKFRERFLFGLNHDLKSPLAVIIGMNNLLKLDKNEDSINNVQQVINDASQKMITLINNFLDVGKLQSGGIELNKNECDLNSLITAEINLIKTQADFKRITLNFPKGNCPIICDEELIQRAFANLLSNAIKFTPEEGSISVMTESFENNYKIQLRDTGKGIPEEKREEIFDMYAQVGKGRKEGEGTGLGLSIVSEIIKAHDGKIWVDPEVKDGASFCIELPKT